jgi:hypothetical protein
VRILLFPSFSVGSAAISFLPVLAAVPSRFTHVAQVDRLFNSFEWFGVRETSGSCAVHGFNVRVCSQPLDVLIACEKSMRVTVRTNSCEASQ